MGGIGSVRESLSERNHLFYRTKNLAVAKSIASVLSNHKLCCFNQIESVIAMRIRTTTIGAYPKPEYVSILHVSPTYLASC